MGYNTDYIGHLDVRPAFNEQEIEYLQAFFDSRRFKRPGGPYDVPGNPKAESWNDQPVEEYNTVAAGQPDLWCGWSVCWDGDCLTWSGNEKSYRMVEWLEYLIAHFAKRGAAAKGHPGFEDFTFDHVVSGTMAGYRTDTRELFAILVIDSRVEKKVLRHGDPEWMNYPPLPYEESNYRTQFGRRRRRRKLDGDTNVVPIARS